jgi:hypothetical protein
MRAFRALDTLTHTAAPRRLPSHRVMRTWGSDPVLSRRRRGRQARRRVLVVGGLLTVLTATWVVSSPVPFLDSYLTGKVTEQIAGRMTCPGSTAPPPRITLGRGRTLKQLLNGRLSEIQLSLQDATVAGTRHADVAVFLHGVHQISSDTPRADALYASVTIGFEHLSSSPGAPRLGGPPPRFDRAEDGSLIVQVTPTGRQAKDVTATLLLKLEVHGETLASVPQQLQLFGHTLPARKVAHLTGGTRTQKLPHLPDGMRYTSISAEQDGLHIGVDGVSTTPLSTLPTKVGDRTVSYVSKNGLLGISTVVDVLGRDERLVIFTEPRLGSSKLTLVPRTVEFLGAERQPDDPIAALVLSQVEQEDFARPLPALQRGLRYKSVDVDRTGIKVAVGGVVVKPFSELPSTADGIRTTFGAEDGLLTATIHGLPSRGQQAPITLFARPTIVGDALDLAPHSIAMLGTLFPAADVLSRMKVQTTRYPLQALPPSLAYEGVEVLPSGLRLLVSGKDVPLSADLLGGKGCTRSRT